MLGSGKLIVDDDAEHSQTGDSLNIPTWRWELEYSFPLAVNNSSFDFAQFNFRLFSRYWRSIPQYVEFRLGRN